MARSPESASYQSVLFASSLIVNMSASEEEIRRRKGENERKKEITKGILKETILNESRTRTLRDTSLWFVPHSSFAEECDGVIGFVARDIDGTKQTYKSIGACCMGCSKDMGWEGIEITRQEIFGMKTREVSQRRAEQKLNKLSQRIQGKTL